jgi:phenylacetate-CoA ligase
VPRPVQVERFLRYRLCDVTALGAGGCACGRTFPALQHIIGRLDDVLVTPDPRRVGRLDPVFKGCRTIREAQLVQETESEVTVRLVPGPDYTDDEELAVVRRCRNSAVTEGAG